MDFTEFLNDGQKELLYTFSKSADNELRDRLGTNLSIRNIASGSEIPRDDLMEALDLAREACENYAAAAAQHMSQFSWLKLSRLVPDDIFCFPNQFSVNNSNYARQLADSMIGASSTNAEAASRFRTNDALNATKVAAAAKFLKAIHVCRRCAAKNVAYVAGTEVFPEARPTDSQRDAIRKYDERLLRGTGLLMQPLGIPVADASGEPTDKLGPCSVIIIQRLEKPLREEDPEGKVGPFEVHYGCTPFDLTPLSQFNRAAQDHGVSMGSPEFVACAAVLRAIHQDLVNDLPKFVACLQVGYLMLESREELIELLSTNLAQANEFISTVFPMYPTYASPAELLEDLGKIAGSTWPMLPGPVVRYSSSRISIDLAAASRGLNDYLQMPSGKTSFAKMRGDWLESAIQAAVDSSTWGNAPAKIRALQGHELKDDAGVITDVDSIGAKGDTILLIDGFSRISSMNDYNMGDHDTYARDARAVEKKVAGEPGKPEKGWIAKCSRIGGKKGKNFDTTTYSRTLAVVVIPAPVYFESGLFPDATGSAMEELEPGLLRASTLNELISWLQG